MFFLWWWRRFLSCLFLFPCFCFSVWKRSRVQFGLKLWFFLLLCLFLSSACFCWFCLGSPGSGCGSALHPIQRIVGGSVCWTFWLRNRPKHSAVSGVCRVLQYLFWLFFWIFWTLPVRRLLMNLICGFTLFSGMKECPRVPFVVGIHSLTCWIRKLSLIQNSLQSCWNWCWLRGVFSVPQKPKQQTSSSLRRCSDRSMVRSEPAAGSAVAASQRDDWRTRDLLPAWEMQRSSLNVEQHEWNVMNVPTESDRFRHSSLSGQWCVFQKLFRFLLFSLTRQASLLVSSFQKSAPFCWTVKQPEQAWCWVDFGAEVWVQTSPSWGQESPEFISLQQEWRKTRTPKPDPGSEHVFIWAAVTETAEKKQTQTLSEKNMKWQFGTFEDQSTFWTIISSTA